MFFWSFLRKRWRTTRRELGGKGGGSCCHAIYPFCACQECVSIDQMPLLYLFIWSRPPLFFIQPHPPLPPHENFCVCDRIVVVVGLFWARQSLLHHDLFDLYWLKQQEIKKQEKKKGMKQVDVLFISPPSSRFVFLESKSQSSQPHD